MGRARRLTLSIIALLFFVSACGQGTEVLNPQDQKTFTSSKYGFSFIFPADWSYTEFTNGEIPGTGVYTDPVGTAETVAIFEKGASNFVVLYEPFSGGETLAEYVEKRSAPEDEIDSQTIDGIEVFLVNQSAWGENGGSVAFIYASDGEIIIALRIEIVANTAEEGQMILDEFAEIVTTMTM